jgi:hypothetical protein
VVATASLLERGWEKKKYYYYNLLDVLMTSQAKNREAKNGQKAMQKQLWSCFHISKNCRHFFGNRKLPASKNIQKTNPENQQKTAT